MKELKKLESKYFDNFLSIEGLRNIVYKALVQHIDVPIYVYTKEEIRIIDPFDYEWFEENARSLVNTVIARLIVLSYNYIFSLAGGKKPDCNNETDTSKYNPANIEQINALRKEFSEKAYQMNPDSVSDISNQKKKLIHVYDILKPFYEEKLRLAGRSIENTQSVYFDDTQDELKNKTKKYNTIQNQKILVEDIFLNKNENLIHLLLYNDITNNQSVTTQEIIDVYEHLDVLYDECGYYFDGSKGCNDVYKYINDWVNLYQMEIDTHISTAYLIADMLYKMKISFPHEDPRIDGMIKDKFNKFIGNYCYSISTEDCRLITQFNKLSESEIGSIISKTFHDYKLYNYEFIDDEDKVRLVIERIKNSDNLEETEKILDEKADQELFKRYIIHTAVETVGGQLFRFTQTGKNTLFANFMNGDTDAAQEIKKFCEEEYPIIKRHKSPSFQEKYNKPIQKGKIHILRSVIDFLYPIRAYKDLLNNIGQAKTKGNNLFAEKYMNI